MNQIKVLAIDLDGVIVDSFQIHVRGWEYIIQLLGGKKDKALFENLHGVPTREAIKYITQQIGAKVSRETFEQLVKIKNSIRDYAISLLDSADIIEEGEALLTQARELRVKTVCFATTTACVTILKRVNLARCFDDHVYGKKLFPSKKSSADYLCSYLANNGFLREECLFIDNGYMPTKHASLQGIPSVHITNGNQRYSKTLRLRSLTDVKLKNIYAAALKRLED